MTPLDLITCLKQIKCQRLLLTCAAHQILSYHLIQVPWYQLSSCSPNLSRYRIPLNSDISTMGLQGYRVGEPRNLFSRRQLEERKGAKRARNLVLEFDKLSEPLPTVTDSAWKHFVPGYIENFSRNLFLFCLISFYSINSGLCTLSFFLFFREKIKHSNFSSRFRHPLLIVNRFRFQRAFLGILHFQRLFMLRENRSSMESRWYYLGGVVSIARARQYNCVYIS